jgi:hypothetical protein
MTARELFWPLLAEADDFCAILTRLSAEVRWPPRLWR